jgi:hypothetical protein
MEPLPVSLLLGKLLALLSNIIIGWKGITTDKHSSLLGTFVNYGPKSFITINPIACSRKFFKAVIVAIS